MERLPFPSRERTLCAWCRENVFDRHTLGLIDRHNATKSDGDSTSTSGPLSLWNPERPTDDSLGPFTDGVDALAYFSNRSSGPIFLRTFTRDALLLREGIADGCVFCFLLDSAIHQGHGTNESNDETALVLTDIVTGISLSGDGPVEFHFTICIQYPWQASSVALSTADGGTVGKDFYFRLYPVDRRFVSGRLGGLTSPTHQEEVGGHESMGEDERQTTVDDHNDSRWDPSHEVDGMALRALIEDCMVNHPGCTLGDVSLLPSMLLQISGTTSTPSVRLVKTSDIVAHPVRYVCLSYCWGGEQPGKTTSSRLSSYLAGIDTALLPNTILDAARATLSLGFEYLWVDAFCIVQDSGPDKGAELNKMSSIYAGAACTLCAMTAKAAAEGFLGRGSEKETTWNIALRDAEEDHAAVLEMRSDLSCSDLTDEPLLGRAWTYQEALLSPRVVMFFSEGQRPAFRCPVGTLRSDGGMVSAIPKSLMSLLDTMKSLKGTNWRHEIHNEWSTIVKQFSFRSVAFQEDRFPALMGIVMEWASRLGTGRYLAGLWSETLLIDLLWRVPNGWSPRSALEPFVAPSWSWASRNHPVNYQERGEVWADNSLARVVACDVTPLDSDVPHGPLKSARLVVDCIAECIKFPDAEGDQIGYSTTIQTEDGTIWYFMFDDDPRPQDVGEVWLLSLAMEEPYNNAHEIGLAVRKVGNPEKGGEDLYVRVGLFRLCMRGDNGRERKVPMRRFTII